MEVSSTEVQNNFGKYLILASKEDIVITRNRTAIAKLCAIRDNERNESNLVKEHAPVYSGHGRQATYKEFLALTHDSEERYEYIDGEIFMQASPKTAHQVALTELFGLFYNWFQDKPCTPLVAPYDIELRRTSDQINIVQPDLMVICDLEEQLDEQDSYKGVPALIVEISSHSTQAIDLIKKLDLYMSCGVEEYWIVNPLNKEITVYRFENRTINRSATYKNGEAASSFRFVGLTAKLERIFR